MAGREDVFQKAMNVGHSAAWDQQWDQAVAAYKRALEEIPDHPKALSSLGMALLELGQFDESLLAYQKAALASPNDPLPLEKEGQIAERMGKRPEAIQYFLKAAEQYIKNQEVDKALANWMHVTQLDPENITAHSYLAMVHERLGHNQQAATEYLTIAAMLQRSRDAYKAAEMIGRALHVAPNSPEARQAQTMLKAGQLLPKPMLSQGGTGALRMPQLKQPGPTKNMDTGLNPVEEAHKQALATLAEVLFDLSDTAGVLQPPRRGMQAIVRGNEAANLDKNDPARIMLYISQAIDAETKNQDSRAAEELAKALETSYSNPALTFELGFLYSKIEQPEDALRILQSAVKHPAYALGSRLLMGQIQQALGSQPAAVTEYMQALMIADSLLVAPDQADALRQLYEPLVEAQAHQADAETMQQLSENIRQLLMRPNWRTGMLQAREQLPRSVEGTPPVPLAEILTQAQSSQIIDSIARVRALARAGHLRSAMDEAFEALQYAPTYLPLHSLIGDLLIQEGCTQDAINKYNVVAEAYSARGEATQAVNLLRRIVQVAPMDLTARIHLIEQLSARGLVDDAIGEYVDLADIYYRLAELDQARKTYTTALRLAQQGGANRAWSVKLLRRMADIDMQRLDWRQAVRIFEQLRTLEPEDIPARKNLIELYLRLNQAAQAETELENTLAHLKKSGRGREVIPFLEGLINENPEQGLLRQPLVEEYRQAERLPEAAAQLVALGDILRKKGDHQGAIRCFETIIAMNPPNVNRYESMLARLRAEE